MKFRRLLTMGQMCRERRSDTEYWWEKLLGKSRRRWEYSIKRDLRKWVLSAGGQ
jgi:hypothetical protein